MRTLGWVGMSLICLATVVASPAMAKEPKRCAPPSEQTLAKMRELGVEELCTRVDTEIDKDLLQLPTEVMTEIGKAIGAIPSGAVVWAPNQSYLTYSIPSDPKYSDYAICGYGWSIVSEIPGPGKYLKHGWKKLTKRTINYEWLLERRPIGQGKTSLHTDVRFSYLPSANLQKAQDAGLCMKKLTPLPFRN